MKSLLLLLTVFSAATLSAQEDEKAIQQWQSLHPSTVLISAERYNSLTAEEQQLLGNDIIVFQEVITLDQLNAYQVEKGLETSTGNPAGKTEDADAIKNWIATHPDVRIIPQSRYAALSDIRLQQANTAECIVLEGEVLTLKDIQHYTSLYGQ